MSPRWPWRRVGISSRPVTDVLTDAREAAEDADARSAARDRREELLGFDEGRIGRSDGWPSTAYAADTMIGRAQQLHSDLLAYRARRNYPAALDAARAKAGRGNVARSGDGGYSGEIYRTTDTGFTVR